jgi:hypothetical protein
MMMKIMNSGNRDFKWENMNNFEDRENASQIDLGCSVQERAEIIFLKCFNYVLLYTKKGQLLQRTVREISDPHSG